MTQNSNLKGFLEKIIIFKSLLIVFRNHVIMRSSAYYTEAHAIWSTIQCNVIVFIDYNFQFET